MVEKGVWSCCRKPHPLVTHEECGENGRCGREGGRLESLFIEGREVGRERGKGRRGKCTRSKCPLYSQLGALTLQNIICMLPVSM